MRIERKGYLAWTVIIFIMISFPTIVEAFQSWDSQLTFKQEEINTGKHLVKFLILFLFSSFVISLPILFKKIRVYYLVLTGILLVPVSLFYFVHVLLFGATPNSATIFSVLATNNDESWEFISDYFSFSILFFPLLFVFGLALLYKLLIKISFTHKTNWILFSWSGVLLIFSIFHFSGKLQPVGYGDIPLFEVMLNYQEYKEQQIEIENLFHTNVSYENIQIENSEPETHVIIIGESTSKHHMGIYNYWRNNTPLLEKERNKLLVFNNVSTPNAHTVEALTKAFSFSKGKQGSLFDLLQQGEIPTWWISNQAVVGEYETPIYLFANKTAHKIFTNTGGFGQQYDAKVVQQLSKVLEEKNTSKRVIFIHLMGTHLSYKERYPPEFDYYKEFPDSLVKNRSQEQINFINQYDNANRYNDFVIHSILTELEKLDHGASMVYFSDHGDEVYDIRNFHGHSDVLQSHYMTDIPFIYWANDQFVLEKPQLYKALKSSESKPFSLKNFSHLAQDLLGIHNEVYDKSKSLIASDYMSPDKKPPFVEILPTLNNMEFDSVIWVHRVNGIGRLNEVKELFNGFEIDVVFNEKEVSFDVNHPPVKSIHLNLETLITSLETPSEYHFWLDFKNASEENCQAAIERLSAVAEKLKIKGSIIVESSCLPCLQKFSDQNFYTGNYLPFLHKMDESAMYASLNELAKDMKPNNISCVTTEMDGFQLVDTYFSDSDKMVWDLSLDWKDEESRAKAFRFLSNNPSVKVLLVRYETPSYR